MAEAVRDHFPGTTIEHVPARPGDFRGRAVSGQLAADLLGWRPTTAFRDGVRQYVDWFLANRTPPTNRRPGRTAGSRRDGPASEPD